MGKAFYNQKGWWKSRTVWVGLIATVYATASLLGYDFPVGVDQTTLTDTVMGVIGLLTVLFRVKATQEIAPSIIPAINTPQ